jgi:DNA-binding CsgD family transcriptional regulator
MGEILFFIRSLDMGTRNKKKELLERLNFKTLDAQFLQEIQHGLNCSFFEAEAVLQVVKEVYFPYVDQESPTPPPGKISLMAVSADEPAGKPVADCQKQTVCLTLHRGGEDDRLLHEKGPSAFRQARISDLCQEALSQGGLLTCEDLAYRIFFVSPRTITRDLNRLRKADPGMTIPLRSTVHDIGPVLTHRTEIVRLALEGKTTSQICVILHHTPPAVTNYLSTFVRCVQLAHRGMQAGQIAFLLRRGKALIQTYLDLLAQCQADKNMAYHLQELLRLGTCCEGEKNVSGRRHHG